MEDRARRREIRDSRFEIREKGAKNARGDGCRARTKRGGVPPQLHVAARRERVRMRRWLDGDSAHVQETPTFATKGVFTEGAVLGRG